MIDLYNKSSFILLLLLILHITDVSAKEHKIERLFPCTNVLEKPYGITAHISRKGWDWELRNKELAAAKNVGINFVRTDLDFPTLMKLGKLAPGVIDSMVISARMYGITVLPILSWPGNYDRKQYYQAYLPQAEKRYKKDFPFIEAVNEPNCIKKNTAKKYSEDIKTIYNTLSKNGSCQILLGGLIGLNKFYDTLCIQKAYKYFDVMNIHYYSIPEGIIGELKHVKSNMIQYGWSKPVWITETGCTTVDNAYNYRFYQYVLPQALKKLHIDPAKSTIGIVEDYKLMLREMPEDLVSYLGYFKNVRFLDVLELANISPKDIQVLIPSFSEYFPSEYRDALYRYVKNGGTIVTNYGLPYYYGKKTATSVTNDWSLYSRLHMAFECWWSNSKAPQYPSWSEDANGWDCIPTWKFSGKTSARFLTAKNLKGKDQFIPIIEAGDNNYRGTVCGIYNLNSELKGNVIVSTWIGKYAYSENDQAMQIPRIYLLSFASGVDKVFWYNLRARETSTSDPESHFGIMHKDLIPKAGYKAYQELTRICSERSTRPVVTLNEDNGVYHAVWTRPDKVKISAYWISGGIIENYISNKNNCYDVYGNKLTSSKVDVGPSIVYVVNE